MLFLVDGYNVTRRDPATAGLPLEEQREALIARLRISGSEMLGSGRIIIVFDGKGGSGLSTDRAAPVEVVYAHRHSADDEIVRIASESQNPVVVVSSDRAVGERVRERAQVAVEIRDAAACFDAAASRRKRRPRGSVARDTGLPSGANAITRELKDLWLSGDDE